MSGGSDDTEVAFARVEAWYAEMLSKLGVEGHSGHIARTRSDDGFSHLERIANEWHWIATERGNENERMVFGDDASLKYQLAKEAVRSLALDYELKNRVEDQDFRRIWFAKQHEMIGGLSPQWQNRLERETAEILATHPFRDDLPDPAKVLSRTDSLANDDTGRKGAAKSAIGKLIVAIILLIPFVLVWWHYSVLSAWHLTNALEERGVLTTATIISSSIGDVGGFRDAGDTVHYAYEVDGQRYTDSNTIAEGQVVSAPEGGGIAIRYLPDDPARSQLDGAPPIFDLLNLVLLDLALIFAAFFGYRRIRAERLRGDNSDEG